MSTKTTRLGTNKLVNSDTPGSGRWFRTTFCQQDPARSIVISEFQEPCSGVFITVVDITTDNEVLQVEIDIFTTRIITIQHYSVHCDECCEISPLFESCTDTMYVH